MPFKAERFLKYYRETIGTDCECIDVGEYNNKTTPKQKSEFIYDVMNRVEENTGSNLLRNIMIKCGTECIGYSIIQKAKRIYKKSTSMESFIEELNAHHIGGGHLKLKGTIIDASYDKCYCGSVSKTKKKISLSYCYCSTGWYKKLFEEILQKEIKVDLIQSIINGADCCRFKIYLK